MTDNSILENNNLHNFIRIEVLLNAKVYNGKPNPKAVLGKILGKRVDLRKHAKEVQQIINSIVEEVKKLSLAEISILLLELSPDAEKELKKKKSKKAKQRKKQKQELPELKNAIRGKFVVRYAPDPSKYPHFGQGMNYLVNRMYADKYNGKVILRFDDTNPAIVAPEYYDVIKEGLIWLGATWDEEVRASSYIDEFYEITRKWISIGDLYVCLCPGQELSKNREQGIICNHRKNVEEVNLSEFEKMVEGKYQPGDAIVRLNGDMKSDNAVMRDPIMLRIVKDQHPMLDIFHYVFPTYDFESAYLETKFGITHVIRSGEFGTMRQELQSYLIKKFGGQVPEFFSFGRFNIQGSPTKGRVIRELVEKGIVNGWDDIRLLTLAGLKKRGIHPKTAKLIIQEAGLNPKSSVVAWQTLESKSKELLEPISKRFFFVPNPIRLIVKNSPNMKFSLPVHPDHPEYGNRVQEVNGSFFISHIDSAKFQVDEIVRLKDLFNFKVEEVSEEQITASYAGNENKRIKKKIQWTNSDPIPGMLTIPELLQRPDGSINEDSLQTVKGVFETSIMNIINDDIVQLERFGFAKVFVQEGKILGHIVHKHY